MLRPAIPSTGSSMKGSSVMFAAAKKPKLAHVREAPHQATQNTLKMSLAKAELVSHHVAHHHATRMLFLPKSSKPTVDLRG